MKTDLLYLDTAMITPRTVVRRFREQDGEAFFFLLQKNESHLSEYVLRFLTQVRSPAEGELYVREKLANWLLQKEFSFGIWDKRSAEIIGLVRLFDLDWVVPAAYVEYYIDQNPSHKEMASEAINAVVNFAFQQVGLKKLYYTSLMDDYEEQRTIRKCGFHREGDLRSAFRTDKTDYVDLMLFGLINPDNQSS